MKHFLLVYDRTAGKLVEQPHEYPDSERQRAIDDRFKREVVEIGRREIEVVVLGAESLEALARTHARYFTIESTPKLPSEPAY